MTREEFDALDGWRDLQGAMIENDYYDELDGDIYDSPNDLINHGLLSAVEECSSIEDLRIIALDELDSNADIWVVSPDFSSVYNYWADDFDDIKRNFEDWLEDRGLFDDEEIDIDEIDAFYGELPLPDTQVTATAMPDDMAQPDIPLQTLMFCS